MTSGRAGRTTSCWPTCPMRCSGTASRIHVQDIKQLKATSEQVEKVAGVADVNAAYDIAQGFVLVRNIATGVAVVLVAMLAVVSLFIIANTIKLAFFYRREEIAIMKMCGATNSFIRWPFIVEGDAAGPDRGAGGLPAPVGGV